MPRSRGLVTALMAFTLMLSLPALAQNDAGQTARTQWHDSIGSGYQRLADHSAVLSSTLSRLCPMPNRQEDGVARMKMAWRDAFLAWQQVRFVDFGPIEQNSRAWQIQFWPDRKNLVGRKVDAWLEQADKVSASAIADAGVAIQGLPAIEYLLFDKRFRTGNATGWTQRCALLTAIGAHLEKVTRRLAEDWQAYGNFYRSRDDFTATTVEAAMNAVEHLRSRRLGAAMGLRGNTSTNAYLGDAWRSGESLAAQQASVAGLSNHFLPGLKPLLTAPDQKALFDDLTHQANETLSEYQSLGRPLKALLDTEAGYRQLQGVYIEVSQLEPLFIGQLASTLDIRRGFNSSDGD
ncbi:hypothetical protein C8D92_1108 [Tamilnaduibacter salinus]|uniref:Imelysin-like domain-containing protein n=1 Tax=Tamilnaduibacter salinus TaxID=1484056 RepID=A0A2U1CTJ4_9GAMM|nr:imelysin family protein [Tamilnaduibacter salinus]PVY69978.1 hypothetical protein C8D92_1108 [Tamilnaduibacter salinus]